MPHRTPLTPRRTWLGLALAGLWTARSAHAQMGAGMGGAMGGGPGGGKGAGGPDCKKSVASAEPVGSTLIKIYAGERLRSLPGELRLSAELMPLYERYAQAVEQLMVDESTWASRPWPAEANPVQRVGMQIDLASNRAAGWEAVLDAVKPLYAALDKMQQDIANKRLVVSLEPAAWALAVGGKSGAPSGPPPDMSSSH